jgi:hypothetical protein
LAARSPGVDLPHRRFTLSAMRDNIYSEAVFNNMLEAPEFFDVHETMLHKQYLLFLSPKEHCCHGCVARRQSKPSFSALSGKARAAHKLLKNFIFSP